MWQTTTVRGPDILPTTTSDPARPLYRASDGTGGG